MDFSQLMLQKQQRWKRAGYFMFVILMVASVLYLMVGEIFVFPFQSMTSIEQTLVIDLRFPRLLAAMFIGAALAVSGATLQVLLGNVLAEPGIIGISGGASVAMVILLFLLP